MDRPYESEPLGPHHDRAAFSCGDDALDRYLRQQAGQDARRRLAAPFVLIERATGRIAGYYTLSAANIQSVERPDDMVRRLPRYRTYPAVLIGRLAVDAHFQGQRIGELLLLDTLRRSLAASQQIAAMAVIVDAKNDAARAFYERYGFRRLADQPYRLYLPMATAAELLGA